MITNTICLLLILASVVLGDDDIQPLTPVPDRSQTSMIYFFRPESVVANAGPFIDVIENIALTYKIEDIEQTLKTSLGKVDIALRNIVIDRFQIGDLKVKTNPSEQTMDGLVDNSIFHMSFDYSLQELSFPYKSESGTGSISTDTLSITASVSGVQFPESGGIDIIINYANFDVGDFTIDMTGGLVANIVTTLESVFSDVINDILSHTITQFLLGTIQPEIDWLKQRPLVFCMQDYYCIDYRLTCNPAIESEGVYVRMKGTMYNGIDQEMEPSFTFQEIPDLSSDRLLEIIMGNATFQSSFNVIQSTNRFSSINMETGEPEPTVVDYSSIVKYFPQWAQAYPEGTNGLLTFEVSAAPSSEIMYNGLRIIIKPNVKLVPQGLDDTTSISSNANVTLIGDLWWRAYHNSDKDVVTDPDILSIEVELASLSYDNSAIPKEWLQDAIVNNFIPHINDVLYELNIRMYSFPGLRYKNPSITYNGNYVVVSTDFEVEY